MFGHRWQVLRASIMILRHLEDRISGQPLPPEDKRAYLELLAATKQWMENWNIEETSSGLRAFREKVKKDMEGAVMARDDAETLMELSQRVLELLDS